CWRKADRTRTWRSWRARSESPRSARSPMPPASPIRMTPSSSTARPATCTCGLRPTWRRPISSGCGCGRAGSCNISPCATSPAVPGGGRRTPLLIMAGPAPALPHLEETGAAGIGLFRTELQFMVAATFPRTAEQFALYRAVLDAAAERPVTFRTLDIGGDKVLPYMRNVEEENPALGWRAIRLGLDRPGLLRSQVRALLRAAGGRELKVMLPMIATVEEFDEAKALVERELTHLRRHSHKLPEQVDIGTMVEVPSLLYQLDELLDRVDFLSVGTNDLVQFFYAADRGNARVAERF